MRVGIGGRRLAVSCPARMSDACHRHISSLLHLVGDDAFKVRNLAFGLEQLERRIVITV